MDKKTINLLLTISSFGLSIAGIIFLIAALLSDGNRLPMIIGVFACTTISNLLNMNRLKNNKENDKEK